MSIVGGFELRQEVKSSFVSNDPTSNKGEVG
ncbi:hypothetical protein X474_27725 [Dethiosulfatarculus sandiegensis]|uniref:Uncharacterized protein n=1 Tax=Dethiosulfatarculus sandiegensis TaxID=1429043 RepID=A0A0D2J502_9BACT|nr:hypothetical protein X474_27725 [Dethiosulfatarculus sandiegensis]